MTYKIKFNFDGTCSPVDVTTFDREETLGEMSDYLVKPKYQTFIDGKKAIIVNLSKVASIEVEEVQ